MNSFVLYKDYQSTVEGLSDEESGRLFKAIYDYQNGFDISSYDRMTIVLMAPLIAQFERDTKKWESKRAKRIEAGKKGGLAKSSNAKQKIATLSKGKQHLANLPVSVSVSGSVREKETNKEKGAGAKAPVKRFVPPTSEEVAAYAKQKGYQPFDAGYFVDFYESKGWMVGKNKMKSWKGAVATASKWDVHFKLSNSASHQPKTTYLFED